jgi:hypothetical protein
LLSEFVENQKILNNNKVCLIDGDIIVFSICFDKKQTDEEIILFGRQSDRSLDQVKAELDSYLTSIITGSGCINYIGYLTEGASFRKDLTSSYKANRKGKELPRYFSDIREYIKSKWGFTGYPKLEADDLLAMTQITFNNKSIPTVIASLDKDFKQIPGEHYNFRKKEFAVITREFADYELFKQVLIGDRTDNVFTGLNRIGDKTADKILEESTNTLNRYLTTTISTYVQQLGLKEGINKFTEVFNLVYLLREETLGFKIPDPIRLEDIIDISNTETQTDSKDLWEDI